MPGAQHQMQMQKMQPAFSVIFTQSVHREANDPCVWLTLASATQFVWPTFGNHRIYQLQPAETESATNVVGLLLAETKCHRKCPFPFAAETKTEAEIWSTSTPVSLLLLFSMCHNTVNWCDKLRFLHLFNHIVLWRLKVHKIFHTCKTGCLCLSWKVWQHLQQKILWELQENFKFFIFEHVKALTVFTSQGQGRTCRPFSCGSTAISSMQKFTSVMKL